MLSQGSARKKDAERMLKKRPLLVLFFMNGCPHCAANEKAWKEAKKKMGGKTAEIEAEDTPDSAGVTGFPTMKYITEGGEERVITGARQSGGQILQELGVPTKGGSRRRVSLRRLRRTRNRKLRHRTLRNNIAFA
jgi:hypothetical protein